MPGVAAVSIGAVAFLMAWAFWPLYKPIVQQLVSLPGINAIVNAWLTNMWNQSAGWISSSIGPFSTTLFYMNWWAHRIQDENGAALQSAQSALYRVRYQILPSAIDTLSSQVIGWLTTAYRYMQQLAQSAVDIAEALNAAMTLYVESLSAQDREYTEQVGAAANAYTEQTGKAAESYAGQLAAEQQAFTEQTGAAAEQYAQSVGKASDAYALSLYAQLLAQLGKDVASANAYTEQTGAAANAFTESVDSQLTQEISQLEQWAQSQLGQVEDQVQALQQQQEVGGQQLPTQAVILMALQLALSPVEGAGAIQGLFFGAAETVMQAAGAVVGITGVD